MPDLLRCYQRVRSVLACFKETADTFADSRLVGPPKCLMHTQQELEARVGIEHNIRFGYSEFIKNTNNFKDYSPILAITFHYLRVLLLTVSLTVISGVKVAKLPQR